MKTKLDLEHQEKNSCEKNPTKLRKTTDFKKSIKINQQVQKKKDTEEKKIKHVEMLGPGWQLPSPRGEGVIHSATLANVHNGEKKFHIILPLLSSLADHL